MRLGVLAREIAGLGRVGPGRGPRFRAFTILCGAAFVLGLPLITTNSYHVRLVDSMLIYVLLGLGLNVVAGFAGLLDMGFVAFFAVGSYSYALLASRQLGIHLPFWLLLPVVWALATCSGLLLGLPALRVRGDYLAIVSLAFGQITRLLIINLDKPVNITNGPNGIVGVDRPSIFGLEISSVQGQYYLLLAIVTAAVFMVSRLEKSRIGRAWMAMRDDAIAAQSMGVNPTKYKMLAYGFGAGVAGVAGVAFAAWQGSVFPENFSMSELVNIYCTMVIGGTGSIPGVFLGSFILVTIPELLRQYAIYRMLIYGFVLVAMMRFRPQGFLPPSLGRDPYSAAADTGREAPIRTSRRKSLDPSLPVLEVTGLSKRFGGVKAVDNVDFVVRRGQIVSIIGPNGAGKTTVFNMVSGLLKPDSGEIRFLGESIGGLSAHAVNALGIARTFQTIRLFTRMSILDNVLVGMHSRLRAGILGSIMRWRPVFEEETRARVAARSLLRRLSPNLDAARYDPASSLNYGDRRRLEIARALASEPDVVLLDEPAAGMNPAEVEELTRNIRSIRDAGYTVVLVEHHMPVVMGISDHVVVLDHGRKICEGKPADVQSNPAVIEAYLGRDSAAQRPARKGESTASRPVLLRLSGVEASYGMVPVLRKVDLEVREGEIVSLLGANGAGKTTLIRAILGVVRATAGEIEFSGLRLNRMRTSQIVGAGISVVPEGRRVFGRLTVEENLEMGMFGKVSDSRRKVEMDRVYQMFPVLKERRRQLAGTLSGGEQQMLAIGRALVRQPRLICLDEPSMGLSPVITQQVFETIIQINEAGVTVFMVEQNARMALGISDRGYVLESGRIVLADTSQGLMDNMDVREAYLGQTQAG